jgi:hypothetical protein
MHIEINAYNNYQKSHARLLASSDMSVRQQVVPTANLMNICQLTESILASTPCASWQFTNDNTVQCAIEP